MITDVQDITRPPDFALQQLEMGVIRRDAVRAELENDDIKWLNDHGFIRPAMHDVLGPTILVRLPELLASETAQVFADELLDRAKRGLRKAPNWVASIAGNLPLGEVVAAQAIIDASTRRGGLPIGIINEMIDTPPRKEVLHGAQNLMMMLPSGEMLNIAIGADGKSEVTLDGTSYEIDFGSEERVAYSDLNPWLILSHVAPIRFAIDQGGKAVRVDPSLLLTVAACLMPLRARRGQESLGMLPTVDISDELSFVDQNAGIVEPITLGILDLLTVDEDLADSWIAEAESADSIALLVCVVAALQTLENFQTHARSQWAEQTLEDIVLPKLQAAFARTKHKEDAGRALPEA